MTNADPRIIHSELSRSVTLDDFTVKVEIYRLEHEVKWVLEVVAETGMATIWDEPFDTEADALAAFHSAVEEEGIACFFGNDGTETVH